MHQDCFNPCELTEAKEGIPEIGHEQSSVPSDPATEQEGALSLVQAFAMQCAICIDWMPILSSAAHASDLSAFLLLRQMGPMRAANRQILSAFQPRFHERLVATLG